MELACGALVGLHLLLWLFLARRLDRICRTVARHEGWLSGSIESHNTKLTPNNPDWVPELTASRRATPSKPSVESLMTWTDGLDRADEIDAYRERERLRRELNTND